MEFSLTEIEDAINYWRNVRPSSGEERALSPEVDALANVYALMIYQRSKTVPAEALDSLCLQLLQQWRAAQHAA